MSKQLNVGGQPNNAKVVQQISQQIEARNLGVDKIILNINGGNSELQTNNNSILKYSLKQPIPLEAGDTVTCINAFVEEKGLQSNTISIEEDISTEMRFMYYKQGDCGDELSSVQDIGWCAYPRVMPDMVDGFKDPREFTQASWLPLDGESQKSGKTEIRYSVGDCMPNMDFSTAPQESVATAKASFADISTGCNGNYYYLVETVKYKRESSSGHEIQGDVPYFRPCYGTKTITVKAGNYSVDSLANIISAQLNGSLGKGNNTFSDALMDKLYFPKTRPNRPLFETTPYFADIDINTDLQATEIIGANGTGEKEGFERRVEGFVKQINYSQSSYFNCWCLQNMWSKSTFGVLQSGPKNPLLYTPPVRLANRITNLAGDTTTFPNTLKPTVFPVTKNFITDTYLMPKGDTFPATETFSQKSAPDAIQLTTADPVLSTNKACHFYMNLAGLKRLFDNTDKKFYSLPDLSTNPALPISPFYPPNVYEYLYSVNSSKDGYVKTFAEGNTGVAAGGALFNSGRASLENQLLCPVNGLTYPGELELSTSRQKFAGTSVAELTFGDSVDNRFAISNLHEFYKLPSLTADGKTSTGYGGQQATKLNNPFYQGLVANPAFDRTDPSSKAEITSGAIIASAVKDNASAVYPVDSTSGIVINNFSFDLVKDTAIYKNAVLQIQAIDGATALIGALLFKEKLIYDLMTKTFSEFFPTELDAQEAWSKSLWARLGFEYNQLGNIKENLETVTQVGNPEATVTHTGLLTHNSFDLSKIVSSDGLGTGTPATALAKNSAGVPMQNYRLNSYYVGKQLTGNYGANGNNIHLLGDSKPITAAKLPSLNNGKSYLLIESDIVKPNFKDNRANWGNLLAIMSKENATNDTIFGASPIDFTITEPKLLTDITIYIKNPDGTLAANNVVGKNNAFIIQIQKAINPSIMPSLEI